MEEKKQKAEQKKHSAKYFRKQQQTKAIIMHTSETSVNSFVIQYFFKTSRLFSKKAMAPHLSTCAWKIPWMEEPGGLQSMGSRRVGHD